MIQESKLIVIGISVFLCKYVCILYILGSNVYVVIRLEEQGVATEDHVIEFILKHIICNLVVFNIWITC